MDKSGIGLEEIGQYLKRYGWNYEKTGKNALLTDFITSENNSFIVLIRISNPWIRMEIPIFLDVQDKYDLSKIAVKLLEINHLTRQSFFAVDDTKRVNLCVDLFSGSGISFEQFSTALDTLTFIAEKAYPALIK